MQTKNHKPISQQSLLMEYFKQHPNQDIPHPEIVDWAIQQWLKRTGRVFRDPDRGIRKLYQEGFLIKVSKGVYRYNPKSAHKRTLEDFSARQKKMILKRDNYQCVICGLGTAEGMELHVDHIKPKDRGGKAVIENGQTLCSQHNFIKKNLNQTETGKKMFIRLYELAKKERNKQLQDFCKQILQLYQIYNINGHIEWKE